MISKLSCILSYTNTMGQPERDPNEEAERARLAGKINEGKETCPKCNKIVTGFSVRFQDKV